MYKRIKLNAFDGEKKNIFSHKMCDYSNYLPVVEPKPPSLTPLAQSSSVIPN